VICCVRNRQRFDHTDLQGNYRTWEVDFLDPVPEDAPTDIDAAYYLIHSMAHSIGDFAERELRTARHFRAYIDRTSARQIIFLSGISNEEELSEHLSSRLAVEEELGRSRAALTVLRAAIIIGSGSASFEIIRDLGEKLPVMIAPRWLQTRCQPIAIRNVIQYLKGVLDHAPALGQVYDIGGPDILTYREMLLGYARVRQLKRLILVVPMMTPRLSSYWLYFVTSTSFPLAVNLVDSMKVEVLARPNELAEQLGITLINYERAIELAFQKIEQNMVVSSWKDALSATTEETDFLQTHFKVPRFGVFHDRQSAVFTVAEREQVLDNLWSIGGEQGWYYGNWLWRLRGWLDKLFGGVGLRRGRTHPHDLHPGDALDFWRVLAADRKAGRLLLFAEMKLPGEAWLEFKVTPLGDDRYELSQVATFRPWGLTGRLYWYLVLPFHYFVFPGMLRGIGEFRSAREGK
ncbi:MAG: SDR family oxidoreductase, partial [Lewinella sp.]|nr:SDR family oxidoreductase [Lewinella sp.]